MINLLFAFRARILSLILTLILATFMAMGTLGFGTFSPKGVSGSPSRAATLTTYWAQT